MTATSRSEFWDWSLIHYARNGVEPLLLQLQDEYGLDANILLWACWCATKYEALPKALVRDAMIRTGPWATKVTVPLRNARRDLKSLMATQDFDGAAMLRDAIQQNELMAEKVEQEILEALVTAALSPTNLKTGDIHPRAIENLNTYASLAEISGDADCTNRLLESLSSHIFTDTPQEVCSKDGHGERRQ